MVEKEKDIGNLVWRLRGRKAFFLNGSRYCMSCEPDNDCQEAADEIERLRAEIVTLRNFMSGVQANANLALGTEWAKARKIGDK